MDLELVNRARNGDREAYEVVARAIAPRLFRIAVRVLRNTDLAHDAVQTALVAIWRELPRLREPERFEAWCYRVALRSASNVLRSERGGLGRFLVVMPDDVATPDTALTVHDRNALEQAFRRLTVEQREVVVLRHYVGLSLDEVASTLEIPAGTARSRLHYALRALRAALEAGDRPAGRQTA